MLECAAGRDSGCCSRRQGVQVVQHLHRRRATSTVASRSLPAPLPQQCEMGAWNNPGVHPHKVSCAYMWASACSDAVQAEFWQMQLQPGCWDTDCGAQYWPQRAAGADQCWRPLTCCGPTELIPCMCSSCSISCTYHTPCNQKAPATKAADPKRNTKGCKLH